MNEAQQPATSGSGAGPLDAPRLNRQVCFAMYSATRATTAAYRPMLEELGLTYPQYLVMLVLWEEQPRSVRELGEELALDSGTLSPLLKRLEALGLVERRRSAADERRVEVFLTDAGAALSAKAAGVPQRLAEAAGLSTAELDQLRDTLNRLAAALQSSR
ncbi:MULTISPECIES: MarR family winged helix-turn-helix transcriptional regulator [Arthrobacter]|uniref:MarR family transcriptional regulator n=1 Tax=Arthrobacter oryzae TaxID=409290 RepID=A0A3N0C5V3_9MICC|nr:MULTISPECIES: MarR family transcriptional regulator [Arthrobacter]QYF90980.1 MarR family transcriptional regulator [Arthrobacter sp. PAMC25284]RNL58069.1 MarR family transcriptional regulator [Arthrobacter oryzae]